MSGKGLATLFIITMATQLALQASSSTAPRMPVCTHSSGQFGPLPLKQCLYTNIDRVHGLRAPVALQPTILGIRTDHTNSL